MEKCGLRHGGYAEKGDAASPGEREGGPSRGAQRKTVGRNVKTVQHQRDLRSIRCTAPGIAHGRASKAGLLIAPKPLEAV